MISPPCLLLGVSRVGQITSKNYSAITPSLPDLLYQLIS
jgi:hypothetical protein